MKIRIFWDTNIILDLLGHRVPFFDSAAKIATLAEKSKLEIVSSALSYSTTAYILSKYENPKLAKEKLRNFKIISEICDLDKEIVEKALNSDFKDFEDSLQYYSCLKSECKILITRNGKDFKNALIPVMSPDEFLNTLRKSNK